MEVLVIIVAVRALKLTFNHDVVAAEPPHLSFHFAVRTDPTVLIQSMRILAGHEACGDKRKTCWQYKSEFS